MIASAAFTIALVTCTVAIHSVASYFLIKWGLRASSQSYARLSAGAAIRVLILLLTHTLEVVLWAGVYYLLGYFPDFRDSVYFSVYATLDYGNTVIKEQYRMLGAVEGLVSLLMMSWSTALLVGYLQRVYSGLREHWGDSNSHT